MPVTPYNPLAKRNLAESIHRAFLEQARTLIPMGKVGSIEGAGVYALYYRGNLPVYKGLMDDRPIYVGKAMPPGSSRGGFIDSASTGKALASRLGNHSRSIAEVANLKVADFQVGHLVVDEVWIPLGESVLIDKFRPLWNITLLGFGNNAQGKGREEQERSLWDTLHIGRKRVAKHQPNLKSAAEIETLVRDYLATPLGAIPDEIVAAAQPEKAADEA